ncbi:MAG: hypothetical protein K2N36_08120, partial [Ruminiclostridium sp.]|nr:hypothetical protein [Ruminiclostridium sp.]
MPDFGFDENVERVFDYGERKFIVTLTTALEIEVFEAVEATQDKAQGGVNIGKNTPNGGGDDT